MVQKDGGLAKAIISSIASLWLSAGLSAGLSASLSTRLSVCLLVRLPQPAALAVLDSEARRRELPPQRILVCLATTHLVGSTRSPGCSSAMCYVLTTKNVEGIRGNRQYSVLDKVKIRARAVLRRHPSFPRMR